MIKAWHDLDAARKAVGESVRHLLHLVNAELAERQDPG